MRGRLRIRTWVVQLQQIIGILERQCASHTLCIFSLVMVRRCLVTHYYVSRGCTWCVWPLGDGWSRVGLFHRCIQFQDVYGLQCRECQVVNEDQTWCILRIIWMCPQDWLGGPCLMSGHEPWWSYRLDEVRRYRRLD